MSGYLTLEEAARVAGHARWLEQRLFTVVGEWVAVETEPAAKARLSAHSLRHAWHASVWGDRFPHVAHLDLDALTAPASPELAAAMDDLAALRATGQKGTLDRLSLLAQVLELLVAAYRDRVARAHPLADGPTVRWLGFLLADEVAALEELKAAMGEPAGVDRRSLSDVGTGGVLGLASSRTP